MLKMCKCAMVCSELVKEVSYFSLGRCPGINVSSFILFLSELVPETFVVLNLHGIVLFFGCNPRISIYFILNSGSEALSCSEPACHGFLLFECNR